MTDKTKCAQNLVAGHVKEEYLDLLYGFLVSRPSGENLKAAVKKHLCGGVPQELAAKEFNVHQSSISRQIKVLTKLSLQAFTVKYYIDRNSA